MRVLLADFDIFGTVGGGQTVYRNLIRRNPDIDFFYLILEELPASARPANAHPVMTRFHYSGAKLPTTTDQLQHQLSSFAGASKVALSVAGQSFDIVEIPDYRCYGGFLGPALRDAGVSYGKLVVSLHGRISKAIELNGSWFNGQVDVAGIAAEELRQYQVADIRYGISKAYMDEWRAESALPAAYLNPLWFLARPIAHEVSASPEAPAVNFVGRFEKWKGPDLFINLIWQMPRPNFGAARLIGLERADYSQVWGHHLREMCEHRQLAIDILPAMSRSQLDALFAQNSITVIPSRWDTLNLVALESIFSGCPTVISTQAGAHGFLKENFPDLPFVSLDPSRLADVGSQLHELCAKYPEYRANLINALAQSTPRPSGPDLDAIYHGPVENDSAIQQKVEQDYAQVRRFVQNNSHTLASQVRRVVWHGLPNGTGKWWRARRGYYKQRARAAARGVVVRAFGVRPRVIGNAARLWLRQRSWPRERNLSRRDAVRDETFFLLKAGQAQYWRYLAKCEQTKGNVQVAAVYWLRWARLTGKLAPGELKTTVALLQGAGFDMEAAVAQALYGEPALDAQMRRVSDILDEARGRNLATSIGNYELFDDRRGPNPFRVSIIVSLYAAESKLENFLENIKHQTLFQAGRLELVLIDSGSPTQERRVFTDWASRHALPVVYARSAKRETIQAAWNRGIALARGEYLTFLGVDEMLIPGALEVLARELDGDPATDWIQANTVVTNVDEAGTFVDDVMTYNRTGYQQGLVFLETCYLSWVGALYRRDIHEKWGYYDPSFRAAGDTEFKSRILPHLQTKHFPETLGYFLNYPEERTTAHPRAEIEDLRAWYLHRSAAGVEQAWAAQPVEAAEATLRAALRYRKSFTRHWSTDVEYAVYLGQFLKRYHPQSKVLRLLPGAEQLLQTYRWLDTLETTDVSVLMAAYYYAGLKAKQIARAHRRLDPDLQPVYSVRNDNRYEQHTMIWGGDGR